MINAEALRDRAQKLRLAASTTEFVDIYEERNELATLLEQCAEELVRLRRPRRSISVGKDNPEC